VSSEAASILRQRFPCLPARGDVCTDAADPDDFACGVPYGKLDGLYEDGISGGTRSLDHEFDRLATGYNLQAVFPQYFDVLRILPFMAFAAERVLLANAILLLVSFIDYQNTG
jgi:hypothetical protein